MERLLCCHLIGFIKIYGLDAYEVENNERSVLRAHFPYSYPVLVLPIMHLNHKSSRLISVINQGASTYLLTLIKPLIGHELYRKFP